MSEELRLKLKAARAKLGLSQSQAAREWSVPLQTLKAWETDKATPRGLSLTLLIERLDAILAQTPAKKRTK